MADDYTDDTSTTGTVTVSNVDRTGVPDTGEIESAGDRDGFAVELVAGTTYRFDLEATGTDALADPYLYGIHDSDGDLVEGTADDNGGPGDDSRVIFTPTASGTYYVSVGGAGDGTGTYGLSATTDVLTHDTTTAGRVTVGGSATGEIDSAGDSDWFAVELAAETTNRFDLEGSPTGGGTLSDPYLNGIHDSDGNLIAGTTDDDSGTGNNARESFTQTASGTWYVSAGTSSGTGTLYNPYLRGIYDSDGSYVPYTSDDDGGTGFNSRVSFKPTESGTYYVSAGAWGIYEGTYTLSVEEAP